MGMPMNGSAISSIGVSSIADVYLGIGSSIGPDVVMFGSSSGKVWLLGRCEFDDGIAGAIILAVNGGFPNGPGATPESGVKMGEVVLLNVGENDDGAVSVNALLSDVVL